jgi:uncharacterized protein HemX
MKNLYCVLFLLVLSLTLSSCVFTSEKQENISEDISFLQETEENNEAEIQKLLDENTRLLEPKDFEFEEERKESPSTDNLAHSGPEGTLFFLIFLSGASFFLLQKRTA